MTNHARSTKDPAKKPNKESVPVEHAQPGPHGHKCQSAESKFPGEPAASSSRTSTRKQFEAYKLSIPAQMKANRQTAEHRGLRIVDEFAEPVSGRKETAKRLLRLRALVDAGTIKHILFSSPDRAFRTTRLAENFLGHMRDLGVHVWVADSCVTHANAHANTTNQINTVMAEHESNLLRERSAKRGEYAQSGSTYRLQPPPGFVFQPIERTNARRLAAIPEQKDLFHAVFLEVALSGVHLAFQTPTIQDLRRLYPQIQTPQHLEALIQDRAYLGLNTYGDNAYETPFTAENRIVDDELFRNANHTLASTRRQGSFDEVAGHVGVFVTIDALLAGALVLCRKCLSPLRRSRLQEHKGLVCPKLECRGTPLDVETLAKMQREGRLTPEALQGVLDRTPVGRAPHEVTVISAAGQEDARASLLRCDNCFEVRVTRFQVTNHGYRKHLLCLSCKTGRWIPRYPWQTRPTGPRQAELDQWGFRVTRGKKEGDHGIATR